MAVITLSSIPPRFGLIGPTLESLTSQRGVDGVELYLPRTYYRFPDWDGSLPKVPAGVTIHRLDHDYGPASKILGAVDRYHKEDIQLLFCDDDRDYTSGWASGLLSEAERFPNCVIALAGWDIAGLNSRRQFAKPRHQRRSRIWDLDYRMARLRQITSGSRNLTLAEKPARRIIARSGYADIFEGYGGVIVRPNFFDITSFNIPHQAFHVDDIWLSGLMARADIGIWLVASQYEPKTTAADRQYALYHHRESEKGRVELNAAAIDLLREKWGIWGGGGMSIPEIGMQ